jgi:alpha/beta superfamily hydrolase
MSECEAIHEVRGIAEGPAGGLETILSYPGSGPCDRGIVICSPSPLLGGDMENNVTEALAREAARRGLAALRWNYRNTGTVDGDTGGLPRFEWWSEIEARRNLAPLLEDARAVVARARRTFQPIALVGYSFGGAIAWRAALDAGIRTCAVICPPLSRLDFDGMAAAPLDLLLVLAGQDSLDPPPPAAECRARFPDAGILYLDEADHFLFDLEANVARRVLTFVTASLPHPGPAA